MKKTVKIGTRGSRLALWQANWVKSMIEERNRGVEVSLVRIKTTGDRILDVPLAKVGGKGLFIKEIEEALLRGDIDLAVHSMKDIPTDLPPGLHIAVITEREDPRDALIISQKLKVKSQKSKVKSQKSNPSLPPDNPPSPPFSKGGLGGFEIGGRGGINNSLLFSIPRGARIGTSSLRRQTQFRALRPDLNIISLRGNLDTRIRKLEEGQFDAIIVASAGVKRLGFEKKITEYLDIEISLPAIGQGAIGIETRSDDSYIGELISFLNHEKTSICVRAERAFLKRLEGGCQVPIAAHAKIVDQGSNPPLPPFSKGGRGGINNPLLVMDGLVGSVSGDRIVRGDIKGMPDDSESLGIRLAEDLLSRGAKEILDEVYGNSTLP